MTPLPPFVGQIQAGVGEQDVELPESLQRGFTCAHGNVGVGHVAGDDGGGSCEFGGNLGEAFAVSRDEDLSVASLVKSDSARSSDARTSSRDDGDG